MRKKLFLLPALLLVASVMFVSSCKKDCSFDQADYVGSYLADEDCSRSAATSYSVIISAGASDTEVKLTNVWEYYAAAVNATIDCESITIPRQDPDGDSYFVEGTGTISKDNGKTTISWSYSVSEEDVTPPVVDECNSTTYTKL